MMLVLDGRPLLGFVGNNTYIINTLWSTYMNGSLAQVRQSAPLRGPLHGANKSSSRRDNGSLDLTTSWSLTSPDRIASVTVCCWHNRSTGSLESAPSQIRLRSALGMVLKTGPDDTGLSVTCSPWEDVPSGYLLAGLMWQSLSDPSYNGPSGRVAFLYAEPAAGSWFYTGPFKGGSPPPAGQPAPSSGGMTNVPGITAGVFVACLTPLAIIGALGVYFKRRKQQQQERQRQQQREEQRQQQLSGGGFLVGPEQPRAPETLATGGGGNGGAMPMVAISVWGPAGPGAQPTPWGQAQVAPQPFAAGPWSAPPHNAHSGAAAGTSQGIAPQSQAHLTMRQIYYPSDLESATDGFCAAGLVGRGPSGSAVYRGELDGAAVAAKRMGQAAPETVGPDLEAAARVLASLQLLHVLRVLGCCPEQHVIVYDWAFGGSLEGRLAPGGPGLGWKDRVRVAAEAGTGLALLHGLTPPLAHGSLHPRNVLLDGEGRAQLADVGLGTAPPEGGGAGPEGDVHALGVLMLRLLGVGGSEGDVVARARAAQSDPTLSALVGSGRAGADWPYPESLGFAHLALKCVGPDPGSRPDLRSVVLPALLQLHNRTRLYGDGPAGPAAAAALPQEGEEEEGDAPTNIPAGFVCPITQELMADPCVAADGFSYERIAIQEWTSRFTAAGRPARSSLTNLPLPHPNVVPNNALKQLIRHWNIWKEEKRHG
ncbi:hypothetical protein HYH03_003571 [Edaphochlamys debaryana]|uniref:U-box domain-containing protein n=1 Tax=Edaphochlamys debaryana TaxID=47281 RepID=A0A836C316_9CHLO|nr:hypothetical protein HYH03_003571 [Edaphochlamys debaryana]|eukprot:KAG2498310.1 hypothetical protein HYH03_003571 [Edaphochlamys debaryana]